MRSFIKSAIFIGLLTLTMLLCACGTSVYMSYWDSDYEILDGEAVSLENINEIEICWARGDVHILAGDGDGLVIGETYLRKNTPAESELARYRISDGKLTIQFCAPKTVVSHLEKDLTVSLPQSLAASLSEITVEVATGDINIVSVSADTVDIDAASGSVSMQSVSARDIELDLAATSLSFEGVTATRRIKINSASAMLRMADTKTEAFEVKAASCDLDFEGSLSAVELDVTSMKAKFTLPDGTLSDFDGDFTNGEITLYLPEAFDGFEADVDGFANSFSSDFSTEKRDEEYIYGNGRAAISMEGVIGKLDIRKILN